MTKKPSLWLLAALLLAAAVQTRGQDRPRGRPAIALQQINFTALGGVNDGAVANLSYIAAGSSNLFRLDNIAWTAADVGKHLYVAQAGAGGTNNFQSGIYAVLATNEVALSNTAVVAATNVPAYYGTDNSAAISNALQLLQVSPYSWQVVCANGAYYFDCPIQDTGSWTNHHNSQFFLPNCPILTGVNNSPYLVFSGTVPVSGLLFGGNNSNVVSMNGVTFIDGDCEAVEGRMIDCQNFVSGQFQNLGPYPVMFNGATLGFWNMTVMLPPNPWSAGIDLEGCMACDLRNVTVTTGQLLYNAVQPGHRRASAFVLPGNGCAAPVSVQFCTAIGFYNGFEFQEHGRLYGCTVDNAQVAFLCTNGAGHDVFIDGYLTQGCATNLFLAASSANVHFRGSTENHAYGFWSDQQANIVDYNAGAGGNLYGTYETGFSFVAPILPVAPHMTGWTGSSGAVPKAGTFTAEQIEAGYVSLPASSAANPMIVPSAGGLYTTGAVPALWTSQHYMWIMDSNGPTSLTGIARFGSLANVTTLHGGSTYYSFGNWESNNLPVINQAGETVHGGLVTDTLIVTNGTTNLLFWPQPFFVINAAATHVLTGANTMYVAPLEVAWPTVVGHVNFDIVAGVSGNFGVSIYSNTVRIMDTGPCTTVTPGYFAAAITNGAGSTLVLQPGHYEVGINATTIATLTFNAVLTTLAGIGTGNVGATVYYGSSGTAPSGGQNPTAIGTIASGAAYLPAMVFTP